MVGTCLTGVCLKAPPLGSPRVKSGTQLGTLLVWPLGEVHGVTSLESQPHPLPGLTPGAGTGFWPLKPSSEPITAYMLPPHDGLSAIEKVWSLIANRFASRTTLGTWAGL